MSDKQNVKIPKQAIELALIAIMSIAFYHISMYFDIHENLLVLFRKYERLELDELLISFIFLAFALIVFIRRRMKEYFKTQQMLEEKNRELEKALTEIKELKGIIPICSSCHDIRDDKGFWHKVEVYVEKHSQAEFTHSLCPECAKKLYPGYLKDYVKEES